MKKSGEPRGTKRGAKQVKDLSAKRSGVKGGYTMFLPDGTPVRAAPAPTTQLKEPGKVEYPN